jgi:exodeoxyribonuclease III
MHLVSWNIAGLSTTLQRIDSDYGSSSLSQWETGQTDSQPNSAIYNQPIGGGAPRKPPRCHAFSYYLQRHEIDILCLQEHKIPYKQLSSRSEPMGCSSVPGYESFWSCCTDRNSRGMNGVVTFAKIGTVRSADPAPLQEEELDSQGRCIRTDHGSFILFNVYVPQGGSCGVPFKLKFLRRLHQKIQECRTEYKKPVILVGDLNIAHQSIDVFWNRRKVNIQKVLEDVRYDDNCDKSIPTQYTTVSTTNENWMLDVSKHWTYIVSVLETKTVRLLK